MCYNLLRFAGFVSYLLFLTVPQIMSCVQRWALLKQPKFKKCSDKVCAAFTNKTLRFLLLSFPIFFWVSFFNDKSWFIVKNCWGIGHEKYLFFSLLQASFIHEGNKTFWILFGYNNYFFYFDYYLRSDQWLWKKKVKSLKERRTVPASK